MASAASVSNARIFLALRYTTAILNFMSVLHNDKNDLTYDTKL